MGEIFSKRQLGKTGLQVSPLGIGGGNGISSEDILYAFEHGINFFFFSSDLHHGTYQRSANALRELCQRGSAVREQVVLATVSYVNDPEKLPAVLVDQFTELNVDYIDIFHWGWVVDSTNMFPLLKDAHALKDSNDWHQQIRLMSQIVTEANEELLRRGLVRYVGASFHSRDMARTWMNDVDVMMLRYNIAHLGAEQDIVPFLQGDKKRDPGIVVFNSAHNNRVSMCVPPPGYPKHQYVPSIPDCYRFALTNPWVDLALTGLRTRGEIDQALAALEQGPLTAAECLRMREYGAYLNNAQTPTTTVDIMLESLLKDMLK
jgi:aryl-alcohol dehydrogenase-like predicted oxidoreductase